MLNYAQVSPFYFNASLGDIEFQNKSEYDGIMAIRSIKKY